MPKNNILLSKLMMPKEGTVTKEADVLCKILKGC